MRMLCGIQGGRRPCRVTTSFLEKDQLRRQISISFLTIWIENLKNDHSLCFNISFSRNVSLGNHQRWKDWSAKTGIRAQLYLQEDQKQPKCPRVEGFLRELWYARQLWKWHCGIMASDLGENSWHTLHFKKQDTGLPWWRSGWESACQCRGHGFEPWSGKTPHAAEQLGPWATIAEPARLEPVLRNKRGCDSERPARRDEEWPPLATTRESPRTETKTQHSQK